MRKKHGLFKPVAIRKAAAVTSTLLLRRLLGRITRLLWRITGQLLGRIALLRRISALLVGIAGIRLLLWIARLLKRISALLVKLLRRIGRDVGLGRVGLRGSSVRIVTAWHGRVVAVRHLHGARRPRIRIRGSRWCRGGGWSCRRRLAGGGNVGRRWARRRVVLTRRAVGIGGVMGRRCGRRSHIHAGKARR